MDTARVVADAKKVFSRIDGMPLPEKVQALNALRAALAEHSPFSEEPVDCVLWVDATEVRANDYNPNSVAPPEMALLVRSISADGYTQPVVAWSSATGYEVVDGFHRHRVAMECAEVKGRIHGYLPIAVIKASRSGKGNRIAATIRHNRARGKHRVDAMSDIVVELKRRGWSNERIGKELGMDPDEVLRLTQITGLVEMFKDREFSEAWEVGVDEEAPRD